MVAIQVMCVCMQPHTTGDTDAVSPMCGGAQAASAFCRTVATMHHTTSATWYDALELSPSASPPLIKAAYRCLAQQHHPDKNPGALDAGARLAQINQAYAVLSDLQRRRTYDRTLGIVSPANERRASLSAVAAPLASGVPGLRLFAFRPLV